MASVSPVGIFEEARDRVIGEIDSIVESLNDKRSELLAEIESLEREFLDRQREKQNDINKLNTLISHTEELGQNTLLEVQQRVTQELNQEMDKLKLDSKQEPNYRIGIKWGFLKSELIQSINSSNIELITDASADCLVLSDAADSSENNTGLTIQPDSSPVSDWESPAPVSQISHSRTPEGYRYTPHLTGERHERQFGVKQFGVKQFGERQESQFGERRRGQFGGKQESRFGERQFGERQESRFGERQFGERQESRFGERQFGERQESQFGERRRGQFGERQERHRRRRNRGHKQDFKKSGPDTDYIWD